MSRFLWQNSYLQSHSMGIKYCILDIKYYEKGTKGIFWGTSSIVVKSHA